MSNNTIISGEWSEVRVTGGKHKGRIGFYDDDDLTRAVVYFANLTLWGNGYYLISKKHLAPVTIPSLLDRHQAIVRSVLSPNEFNSFLSSDQLLKELNLVEMLISQYYEQAKLHARSEASVFISHASRDKPFARRLATDLSNRGYKSWLDEWSIKVGESIPAKVSEGLSQCKACIVVLSEHSTKSRWVEAEWQAKYWNEINTGKISVLPVVIQACQIPLLLQTKRYADFREDYDLGLSDILDALLDDDG